MDLSTIFELTDPQYAPIEEKELSEFDSVSIMQWFSDPEVRATLLSPMEFTIQDQENENIRMENTNIFNSRYTGDYTDYVKGTMLPGYLRYLEKENIQRGMDVSNILIRLLSVAEGELTIPSPGITFILSDIFPPSEGTETA